MARLVRVRVAERERDVADLEGHLPGVFGRGLDVDGQSVNREGNQRQDDKTHREGSFRKGIAPYKTDERKGNTRAAL